MTAYDTGSSGFNIAVAVGKSLKDKNGSDVRVLPAGNDVARLNPLRADRAQASAMGIGGYFAQESVFEFAVKDWGPQQLQAHSVGHRLQRHLAGRRQGHRRQGDQGPAGKRVGMVVGSPALNQNAFAVLAFGGLTRSDVKLVEFSSYGAMWKGMVNNEIDAAIASNISGQVKEVETSPRGIIYPAHARGRQGGMGAAAQDRPLLPAAQSRRAVPASRPGARRAAVYPYPIFMAYASQPAALVYNLTKAMIDNYDAYKDAAPGAAGLDVKRQNLAWVLPYHEGAVKALKEAGAWKAEHEAHNQKLLKRQETLVAAWAAFLKTNPPDDKDAFAKAWSAARKTALTGAGMDPVFD